jgi:hypothetical protein
MSHFYLALVSEEHSDFEALLERVYAIIVGCGLKSNLNRAILEQKALLLEVRYLKSADTLGFTHLLELSGISQLHWDYSASVLGPRYDCVGK